MLSIEHFYLLLAAFLAYAGWRNLRERRYAHAAFWGLIALLFAAGQTVLSASRRQSPASQWAGAGVIALALLARGCVASTSPKRRIRAAGIGAAAGPPAVPAGAGDSAADRAGGAVRRPASSSAASRCSARAA
jgi:hypothetical protein